MAAIETPEDAAYDEPWTVLLTILENAGIPSISPGECMRLVSILHKVNALILNKIIGSNHEEIFRLYLCSLQTVVLVNSRQIELNTSEMFEMFEDMGIKPLGSIQVDEEEEDAESETS